MKYSVLLLLVVATACTPTSPTTINNTNTATNTSNGGNTASPSPGVGSGTLPPGSRVAIFMFGQSCPAGATPPSNGSGILLLQCVGFLTATPKDANGNDLDPAVHGPNCAWQSSGTINLTSTAEPFNRDGRCSGAGPSTIQATVKDVTGTRDFRCQATAAGLVGDVSVQSVGSRVYFWDDTIATASMKADAIKRDQAFWNR